MMGCGGCAAASVAALVALVLAWCLLPHLTRSRDGHPGGGAAAVAVDGHRRAALEAGGRWLRYEHCQYRELTYELLPEGEGGRWCVLVPAADNGGALQGCRDRCLATTGCEVCPSGVARVPCSRRGGVVAGRAG